MICRDIWHEYLFFILFFYFYFFATQNKLQVE